MELPGVVATAAAIMEATGVFAMLGGALLASATSLRVLARGGREAAFRLLRRSLGRSILLGLEFLVAADIIRTVSEIPTIRRVVILAGIVLIRTFLSFTLELEVEGRWPWHRADARREVGGP